MRELSIEEKAKAYNKAIERLRNAFYNNNSRMCEEYRNAVLKIIEPIFPELKESEDERIRKALVTIVTNTEPSLTMLYGVDKADLIAWLEKQGEQKPADKVVKFNVGDKVYNIKNRFECTIESIDDTTYYCDTTNFDIKDQNNWELVEKKHTEWSEEDERNFYVIYGIIYNSCNAEDASRLIAWLKAIKARVQPQPKQEWNEEDSRLINEVIELIDAGSLDRKEKDDYIERLKSLNPQKHWKPSDEQMDALESAIVDSISSIQKHSLESLYNELKKLF